MAQLVPEVMPRDSLKDFMEVRLGGLGRALSRLYFDFLRATIACAKVIIPCQPLAVTVFGLYREVKSS
mgnify:CR=1 FL=1